MARGIFTLKQQLQGLQQRAWSGTMATPAVDYLVVAGGGAGGSQANANSFGGGGGGGGVLQGSVPVTAGSAITVTVGGGGTAASNSVGTSGQNSVFGSISATGGGYGGRFGAVASGGSGGGNGNVAAVGPNILGGAGTFGQGNAGGNATLTQTSTDSSGGGGGAGTVGLNGGSSIGGNGGAGIASAISGTVTTYAGGGGGCSAVTQGTGGAGGGGAGVFGGTATAGTAYTGGGGGGAGYNAAIGNGLGGNGGSGIVIVSYPDVYAAASGTTGSPTVSTSGAGSISLNGSSQGLNVASTTALGLGTSNWTIECWAYGTSVPSNDFTFVCDMRTGSNDAPIITMRLTAAGATQYTFRFETELAGTIAESSAVSLNTWYHLAFVRNSGFLYCYLNGTLINTGGTATTLNNGSSCPIAIGYRYASAFKYFSGYLSNFRIVKGSAVYTSNFTPSTTPLTPISNTALLLNSVSGSYLVDSSSNSLTVTQTGSPTWNQSSPFATGLGYKNRVYTYTASGTITF